MEKAGTVCGVLGCKSSYSLTQNVTPKVTYMRCPKDEEIRRKWYEACRKTNVQFICSLHFEEEVLVRDKSSGNVSLLPGSLPTLNLPSDEKEELQVEVKPIARKSTTPKILVKPKDDIESELSLISDNENKPQESESEKISTDKELLDCLQGDGKIENLPEAYVLLQRSDVTPKVCCISDCSNDTSTLIRGKSFTFHPFPKDSKMCKKWVEWSKAKDPETSFVCSEHFTLADFEDDKEGILKVFAVPSKKPLRDAENLTQKTPGKTRLKSTHVVRKELESEPETEIAPPPKKPKIKKEESTKKRVSGIKCCVENCKTVQGDGFHFYPFPSEKLIRKNWLQVARYTGPMTDTTAVCAKHFLPKDFVVAPGTNTPSSRLRRGTIPSRFLPSSLKRNRKVLKEVSSDEDDIIKDLQPKKDRKLGKKIEIVAEFDEENDGSVKKSYKVIIKKIRRKGEGERKRGLLMDCKNSLTLVKKIIEGLDITRMQEIKFKPGETEESRVVLTGSGGGPPKMALPSPSKQLVSPKQVSTTKQLVATKQVLTPVSSPVVKALPQGQAYIRIPASSGGQQVLLPQSIIIPGQQPMILVQSSPQVVVKPNPANPPEKPSQSAETQPSETQPTEQPDTSPEKKAEISKVEDEMAKCKLTFELQRYKSSSAKQGQKIKILQQTKKKLEKKLGVLKKTLDIARKESFVCVFQDPQNS